MSELTPVLERSFGLAADAARFDAVAAAANSVIPSDRFVGRDHPLYVERADGAYFWDIDGNRYLDFMLAYGTIILGHQNPVVDSAVIAELGRGFSTGLMKPMQAELAEELVRVTPHAEMAMFLKTGSDATSAAVRLARAFTGRERVIRWGYNGWHDWCAQRSKGVPASHQRLVSSFDFNNVDSLRSAFEACRGEVACLLMMPFELEPPAPEFLDQARRIASEHGALFVLDEMRSGFRLALGGAQEYFGVEADLVTFSKALANGYTISAVVGRRDVLSELSNVHISSTFYANSDSMAAALATIRQIEQTDVLARIWTMGSRLQAGLHDLIVSSDVDAEVIGLPPMPFLQFASENQKHAFFTTTTIMGVFLHPNHHWFLCGAMTESDIDMALDAAAAGFGAANRTSA